MKCCKYFIQIFLLIQICFLSGLIKNVKSFDLYFLEVLEHIFFSTTALKHQYNFFTMPAHMHYRYYVTNMHLIKLKGDSLEIKAVSKNGSIKHLVHSINQCRVSNVIPVSFSDTLYFEAIARSHALYFLKDNPTFSVFHLEILETDCELKRQDLRYAIQKDVKTVYKRDFYLD